MIDDDALPESRLSGRSRRWKVPVHEDPSAESAIRTFVGPGPGTEETDDEEEASRRAWDEAFVREQSRFARYGRPVTIVVAELQGLDSLASILGQDAADRLIPTVAVAMRRYARIADFVARIGHARFVALLSEADEPAALASAQRVCSLCNGWLAAGGVRVRLALGWAQPVAGGRLADALRLAEDRMNADRRRQGFGTPRGAAKHHSSIS